MKINKIFSLIGVSLMIFIASSCNNNEDFDINPYYKNIVDNGEKIDRFKKIKNVSDYQISISDEFSITTEDGEYEVSKDSNGEVIYTLTKSGTYDLKGLLDNGRIYMDDINLDINIHLLNCKIVSYYNSPIFAKSAKSLTVKAMEDTYNEILDLRDAKTSDLDTQGEASIYAKSDLKVSGKGALGVYGNYNNGIATTDDLYIKSIILASTSRNNSIKGNDSITIESGDISVESLSGDGLKTDNSDISDKGNQHGSINILGGMVDIYSYQDGIDSAYDVKIEPYSNIAIHEFRNVEFSKEDIPNQYFIKTTKDNYRYSLYNENSNEFLDAAFLYSKKNTRTGELEYYYVVKNNDSKNKIYVFDKNKDNSLEDYIGFYSISNFKGDLIEISFLDSKTIFNQNYYSFSNQTFKDLKKNEYSCKGIKANNLIEINGGYIRIDTYYDDAIHANASSIIESKSQKGKGDIVINGGLIEINAQYADGIHADGIFTLNYGSVYIHSSIEGLEGNIVNINGGRASIYSSDDGINASGDKYNNIVNITGGEVTVKASTGDAIDSNGDFLQSGGFLSLYANTNLVSDYGSCIDVENKFEIKSGTIICFGKIKDTPTNDINYVLFNKKIYSGDYQITNCNINFEVAYESVYFAIISSSLKENNTYSIKGRSNYTWTQEKGKTIYEE